MFKNILVYYSFYSATTTTTSTPIITTPTTPSMPNATTTPGLNCENDWEAPSGWTAGDEPNEYYSFDCVNAPLITGQVQKFHFLKGPTI